jgi:hypothetical protein
MRASATVMFSDRLEQVAGRVRGARTDVPTAGSLVRWEPDKCWRSRG